MSGSGDFVGANEGEELSAPNLPPAEASAVNITASGLFKGSGDHHSPLASEEDLEAVIEKKLNPEKEKAPDIDSELDFELKWDDDALNYDEPIADALEVIPEGKVDEDDGKAQSIIAEKEIEDEVIDDNNTERHDTNVEKIIDSSLLVTADENILGKPSGVNVFQVDTIKLDLAKVMDSDNNSLDEHLVYSDIDAPELEDKVLLDEIDAQISDTDKKSNDDDSEETLIPEDSLIETKDDGLLQVSLEDLNSTASNVDDNPTIGTVEKVAFNDTFSTITDMETSSYEINMDHKLGKLDAMIEIPTQELIEDLDGSGELSEGAEQYDEDMLLGNDADQPVITEIESIAINEHEKREETPVTDYDEEMLLDNDTDQPVITSDPNKEIENIATNVQQTPEESLVQQLINIEEPCTELGDILVSDTIEESNKVNRDMTEAPENDTELTSEKDEITEVSKSHFEDEDVEMTNESHADIILEASHIEPEHLKETKCDTDEKEKDSSLLEDLGSKLVSEVDMMHDDDLDIESDDALTSVLTKEISNAEEIEPVSNINIEEENIAAVDALEPKEVLETEDSTMNYLEPNNDTKMKISSTDDSGLIVESVTGTESKTITKGIDIGFSVGLQSKEATEIKNTVSSNVQNLDDDSESKNASSTDNIELEVTPLTNVESQMITDVTTSEPSLSKEATKTEDTISSNDDTMDKEISPLDDLDAKVDIAAKDVGSTDLQPKEKGVDFTDLAQPSTSSSNLLQELSDEDQVTDSLGLLAESSRVMDDDDEQEQEDDDDDDDFDQDDESNQMTAEHSEDSNAQHSETDAPQETMDAEPSGDADKELHRTPEIASAETVEPDAVLEECTDEVEKALQALISSNDAKGSTEVQPTGEPDKLSNDDSSGVESDGGSRLRELLCKADTTQDQEKSPSKMKKIEISKQKHEYSIVDLEESSSEDDVQEVNKPPSESEVTSVNIPDSVEVTGSMTNVRQGEGEVVISVPKPPAHKPTRLNTSELTIKTAVSSAEPLSITDAAVSTKKETSTEPGLEIFNLDSDDDEKAKDTKKPDSDRDTKCINVHCTSDSTVPRASCDAAAAAYYGGARRGAVCARCLDSVYARAQSLIEGVKDFTPLLSLDMGQIREELVEISDSESDDEPEVAKRPEDAIGAVAAKFLEENLEDVLNATWLKYNMESRLKDAQSQLDSEVRQLEAECKDIDAMLSECQVATDKLRCELYDTFAHERQELPAILIYDTPVNVWSGLEDGILAYEKQESTSAPTQAAPAPRQSKRRLPASAEPPAKRAAIPLGYTPLDRDGRPAPDTKEPKPVPASSSDTTVQNDDDNADISVVKLSAESAPAGLPPPGVATRPPLRAQMPVYAMRNAFGAWQRARIADVQPRGAGQFTMCRVKFEHKVKNPCKVLPARCLAYDQPSDVRMTIGTRVIALFADTQTTTKSYYSGIIAEIPNPVNNYRYLVFFDDGYAQYVQHANTRLVCECAPLVWDEVHPFSRNFVRDYLRAYPERPMVRAHPGQSLKTEWNGKWWVSKVIQVDASLVQVHFEEDNRTEWIYRGSTRLAPLYLELQAAGRQRARPLPRAGPGRKVNMPYVEYTRSDEPTAPSAPFPAQIEQDIRRQRAVAKKSTALPPPAPAPAPQDGVSSRVVFYTPKNAIKPLKMVPHNCSPRCRRTDVLALKDLRTYNPLTKPLLSGWERQIVKYRFTKSVMYRAPCGRRIRDYRELHRYLRRTGSDMPVDLFDFGPHTHCLAEFVLNKCLVSKKDLSHGKENVPVPCVNYYDSSLPEFCSYNTERTPTAGVPLNLDPEFLCGCDCTDDCADKSKCACWKMTLEGARTIGLDGDVGYVYKRLPEPLPSGIYECNSRCKCRHTCLNRVAQHPLQLKLQVFKTLNRGWGIRALNDVPKGSFLCVYAGNLLTDATANLDGLNEGDEYLAELDYIEVVEQMKEGFEEDIPDADKKLDQEEEESSSSSSDEEQDPKKDDEDDDFRPEQRLLRSAVAEYSKRLRKREKKKKEGEKAKKEKQKDKEGNSEDCITISDDEELREPSRFAAQAGMGGKEFVSKYKSVRAHFGKDEACYIMDAKVQGNIGRYLNHSCTPNVFVQNVFVDTHDPRFPWVAFFALAHIRAGAELTWNYNYDVGSVPGKVLYCHCAAPNCRGRLL